MVKSTCSISSSATHIILHVNLGTVPMLSTTRVVVRNYASAIWRTAQQIAIGWRLRWSAMSLMNRASVGKFTYWIIFVRVFKCVASCLRNIRSLRLCVRCQATDGRKKNITCWWQNFINWNSRLQVTGTAWLKAVIKLINVFFCTIHLIWKKAMLVFYWRQDDSFFSLVKILSAQNIVMGSTHPVKWSGFVEY